MILGCYVNTSFTLNGKARLRGHSAELVSGYQRFCRFLFSEAVRSRVTHARVWPFVDLIYKDWLVSVY